jgi:outer membrane protein OmpA-like peptidoglycan-associated protein
MIHRLTGIFISGFISIAAFGQTYEVVEVEMVGSATAIDGINTEGADFAPFVSGNKLYFTSSREFDLFNVGENNWTKGGYLNVYMAEYKGEVSATSKFKNIELVSEKIKTDSHTGPVAFSVTGDTLFFTQVVANKKKSKKNKFRPQLFMAVRDGNNWNTIQSLPFNNNEFSFGHPSYDSQKQRLYFASDIAGGKGQKDIYYVDLVNGAWGTPVNLEAVNTESNELFPFYIEGHLFIASDRTGGEGGLDIYWKTLGQLDPVQKISGLNSAQDDFGVYVFPGMQNGYISSNRNGNDDIFFLDLEKKVTVKRELAGMFTYRNLNTQASNLKVQVIGDNDELLYEATTNEEGEFYFRNLDYAGGYTIRAVSEDDLNLVIYDKEGNPVIDLVSDEQGDFTYKRLQLVSSGLPSLLPENMIDPGMDYGHLSGQLLYENIPGQYPANLEVMLYDENGNGLTTRTDNSGNFDFRQLSLNENYTLKVAASEDELVLLIFDKYGNVVAQLKANDEGQFTYRKLSGEYVNSLAIVEEREEIFELETQTISGYFEYKKLSGISSDGLTIYAYDDDGFLLATTQTDDKGQFRFRSLPTGTNILFKLDENDPNLRLDDFTLYIYDRYGKKVAGLERGQSGYFIYKPLGFEQNNSLTQVNEDSLDIDLALVTNYDVVTVYFDSNQSSVKSDDFSDLNKIYITLKANPNLKMEINAYADARASDDYNLVLSQKRGEWIVEYMVKKGIPRSQFIVNAYGETQLVDEANDALNRRAEIRLY